MMVPKGQNSPVNLLASKIGESVNAHGEGGAGLVALQQGETASVKCEAEMLSAMPVQKCPGLFPPTWAGMVGATG